jgi:hypothetical protein
MAQGDEELDDREVPEGGGKMQVSVGVAGQGVVWVVE